MIMYSVLCSYVNMLISIVQGIFSTDSDSTLSDLSVAVRDASNAVFSRIIPTFPPYSIKDLTNKRPVTRFQKNLDSRPNMHY